MGSRDNPTPGDAHRSLARGVQSKTPPRPVDCVKDVVVLPEGSRPAGSVALDFSCDVHGERLVRLWMSPKTGGATFGGEGRKGAWDADTSGRGAVVVTCTLAGCHTSAVLSNDWLVARFGKVRADFDAGRGLPIAWFSLSQVGASSS